MPVTRSQTAALRKAAQSSTNSDPQLGGITNRINNRRFGAINTSKKKKKRRKKGTLSMRKKPTHTKGQGDGCENNPYFASRKAIKQRVYRSNRDTKREKKAIRKKIRSELDNEYGQTISELTNKVSDLTQQNTILHKGIATLKKKLNLNNEKMDKLLMKMSDYVSTDDEYVYVCTDDIEADDIKNETDDMFGVQSNSHKRYKRYSIMVIAMCLDLAAFIIPEHISFTIQSVLECYYPNKSMRIPASCTIRHWIKHFCKKLNGLNIIDTLKRDHFEQQTLCYQGDGSTIGSSKFNCAVISFKNA
eukprot:929063_1